MARQDRPFRGLPVFLTPQSVYNAARKQCEGTFAQLEGLMKHAVFLGALLGLLALAAACGGGKEAIAPDTDSEVSEGETPVALPAAVALPPDYPADIAPIPAGARIIDVRSVTSGGEISTFVTYLTKEDPESVADFYDDEVPGEGWEQTSRVSREGDVGAVYRNDAEDKTVTVHAALSDIYAGYTVVALLIRVPE